MSERRGTAIHMEGGGTLYVQDFYAEGAVTAIHVGDRTKASIHNAHAVNCGTFFNGGAYVQANITNSSSISGSSSLKSPSSSASWLPARLRRD